MDCQQKLMLLKPQNKTPKAYDALGVLFCGGDGRLEKYTQTRLFDYFFFLKIKFVKNNIIIAPIAPVKIEPTHPSPREMLNTLPKSQYPRPLPRRPIMIFPTSPNPLPLYIVPPSHPAMAPIISVAIIPMKFNVKFEGEDKRDRPQKQIMRSYSQTEKEYEMKR